MMNDNAAIPPEVESGINPVRLASYLNEVGGDSTRALALYAWNSRMSAECFIAIGHLEVLLRNAIDCVMRAYSEEDSLGIPWFLQLHSGLQKEECQSVSAARDRIAKTHKPDSRDRVVAELTFGFWSRLFSRKYDALWRQCLNDVFKDGSDPNVTRKEVAALVESVRVTRNRVAHQNYMKEFNVPKAMHDVFRLTDLISPAYSTWMQQDACHWREVYDECPEQGVDDTLIVPGRFAWRLYQHQPVYMCQPERPFRDAKYLGFYESRVIRGQIPRILNVYERVHWTLDDAERLSNSDNEYDRKLGSIIQWTLSDEGQSLANGWVVPGQWYKVLLLTRYRESTRGDDGHLDLPNGDVPHTRPGAFVRNHRYVSSHNLSVARSTDDL